MHRMPPEAPNIGPIEWSATSKIESRQFTCGYCSSSIASDTGYMGSAAPHYKLRIYICHSCLKPNFFDIYGTQYPSGSYGKCVDHLPNGISELYEEARNTANLAPTACALCCRKLLMNIAVEAGANEGLKFIEYVDYLSNKGYVPPNGREWVDTIRQLGNEATHEIRVIQIHEAEELVDFSQMLLTLMYELPKRAKRSAKSR